MKKQAIKLVAGQQVKTPYDSYSPVIIIGTSKEFSKDGTNIGPDGIWVDAPIPFHIEGWKIWETRCGRDWKTQYIWVNQRAACLTSNYPGKAAEMDRKAQAYVDAQILDDGDIVEIDGFLFEVYCIKRQVSDPIMFTFIGDAINK